MEQFHTKKLTLPGYNIPEYFRLKLNAILMPWAVSGLGGSQVCRRYEAESTTDEYFFALCCDNLHEIMAKNIFFCIWKAQSGLNAYFPLAKAADWFSHGCVFYPGICNVYGICLHSLPPWADSVYCPSSLPVSVLVQVTLYNSALLRLSWPINLKWSVTPGG